MNEEQQVRIYDILCDLPSEKVLRLMLDYHGWQLIDDGFREHLIDEGVLEDEDEEDEEDESEDEESE